MAAHEVLTLGWTGDAAKPAPGAPAFVLVDEPAQPAPVARPPRPVRRAIDAQVLGTMRDLVIVSYLGAQFPEDRDQAGVAQYTTETTRDAFPRRLVEELGECITEGGPAGRLPAEYVASLARGTTRVVASETRPKKKGAVLLGPFAYQDAHVIKTIATLAPEHGQWLRYAYGDSLAWEDEQGAVVALWARVQPILGKIQAKTLQRVRSLAHLAVQAGKARMNSGREIHGSDKLMQLLGVARGNYDVHWAPRWKLYAEQLEQLDREALAALARALGDFDYVLEGRGLGPSAENGNAQSISDAAARAKKSVGVGLKTREAAVLHLSGKLLSGGSLDVCECTDIRPPAPGQSEWTIRAEPCARCDRGGYSLEPIKRIELRLERLQGQLSGRGLVLELGQRFFEPR